MYLELIDESTGDEVAEVIYSDATHEVTISVFRPELPLRVVEVGLSNDRRRAGRAVGFVDGSHRRCRSFSKRNSALGQTNDAETGLIKRSSQPPVAPCHSAQELSGSPSPRFGGGSASSR